MRRPSKVFRYRPLDETRVAREMDALENSYLFSSSFAKMNDPMEAFYETGEPGDKVIDAMIAPSGKTTSDLYAMLRKTIDSLALVSFASTHEDLPMWAYYASNFAGMCLEFEASDLTIGDLQNEKLLPVIYARSALPSLTMTDMASDRLHDAVVARITRKRSEWSHEKEWRFITGQVGRKYYLDDALRRVFLGPRVKPEHVARVCNVLARRPVEVLQGEIRAFKLMFRSIKPAYPLEDCERVGAGRFNPADALYARKKLEEFLTTPFQALVEECQRIALRPNMEELFTVDISNENKEAIYCTTIYKLRSGRDVYHNKYFDSRLRPLLEKN